MNKIQSLCVLAGLLLVPGAFASPVAAPAPTAAAKLENRATTCTFSGSEGASSASKSKTSCSTIVLSAVAVPSGVTLDLTDLNEGTHVSSHVSSLFVPAWVLLTDRDRSFSKARLPSATRSGMDPLFPFPELTSPWPLPVVLISTVMEAAGGTVRVRTEERPSPSSSMLMTWSLPQSLVSTFRIPPSKSSASMARPIWLSPTSPLTTLTEILILSLPTRTDSTSATALESPSPAQLSTTRMTAWLWTLAKYVYLQTSICKNYFDTNR